MSQFTELAAAIAARLGQIEGLGGASITYDLTPRYKPAAGVVSVFVTPASQTFNRDARDVLAETTAMQITLAAYTAGEWGEIDPDAILALVPEITLSLLYEDFSVDGRLYHLQDVTSSGAAFVDSAAAVDGGLFDSDALGDAYIFQVPLLLTFQRFLKMTRVT